MKDPVSAAEALTGLARIRPPGWLTTPIPSDPNEILRRASAALQTDHPTVSGQVTLLSARYTAAVLTVHTPSGPLVLKLHGDPAAYAGETLAYALLADTAPVPHLLGEGDDSQSLLIEFVPKAADWTSPTAPAALADCVAAVHTASIQLSSATAEVMADFSIARLLDSPAPGWITDPSAWHDVLAAHHAVYGPGHIPLGHLDLKPDHLRSRADGAVVLVDLETVRPDITGLIDLVTLPAVYRQAGHDLSAARILELYLDATAAHGADWTTRDLKDALRAFAAATNLQSLHGLDQ